jgi:phospholipid/cholesterol/gamma-HCH transport system substrate-binding protein
MKPGTGDRQLATELAVGVFMFIMLIVLAYLTVVVGGARIFKRTYPLEITFENAAELRKGDGVVARGMTVGKVRLLTFTAEGGVRVTADLDLELALREDYRITAINTGLFGGRYVQIEEGSRTASLLTPGTALRGVTQPDVLAEATIAITQIRHALQEGGVLTNLEATVANLRAVADKIGRGEGTIGKLLASDAVYNDLQAVGHDLRDVTGQLKDMTDKLGRGEGTIGKLMQDDAIYADLKNVMGGLKTFSQRITDGQGTLGKLMSSDDALYKDLATSVASVKEITGRIERGEGLIGKLTKDPELYNELKASLVQVRAAVDDFRETTPVVSFASLLFGAF